MVKLIKISKNKYFLFKTSKMPLYYGIVLPLDTTLQILSTKFISPDGSMGDYLLKLLDDLGVRSEFTADDIFQIEHNPIGYYLKNSTVIENFIYHDNMENNVEIVKTVLLHTNADYPDPMARIFIGNEIVAGQEAGAVVTNVPVSNGNTASVVSSYNDFITPLKSDYVYDIKTKINGVLVANGFTEPAQFYLTKHGIGEDLWGGE